MSMEMKGSNFVGLAALVLALISPVTVAAWFEVPETAESNDVVHEGKPRVRTQLVTDANQVAPGDTFRVGVAFELDKNWHIYWQNSGDAGLPTDITWSSEQVEFGPLRWAAPERFTESDGALTVFGYADQVILFSEATVAEDAAETIEVSAKVDYLACREACMPGAAQLHREIPVGENSISAETDVLSALEKFSSRVPRPASAYGLSTEIEYSSSRLEPGGSFRAALAVEACGEAASRCVDWKPIWESRKHAFVTGASSKAEVTVERVQEHPSAKTGWVFQLEGEVAESAESGQKDILSGVLRFKNESGASIPVYVKHQLPLGRTEVASGSADVSGHGSLLEISTPTVESASVDSSIAGGGGGDPPGSSFFLVWWMLVLAFAGGMLLNLMPCVFPVLALKVTSFAEIVQESRRGIWAHGAAYTGGIVGSMMVLASVVVGLQLAGHQVGWGFQFQEPMFPAALAVVVTLFTLNLFGVFDVSVDANQLSASAKESKGLTRSAGEGVLAVVLATPCSAPFLGTAVGFAFASGWMTIVSVFVALGLGLAAPFVVLTLVPGWAKLLPRPGAWMGHLKHFLGFALAGTVVWLVWLVGRQAGVDAMATVLAVLVVISVAAWAFGLVQYHRSRWKKWAVTAVALVSVVVAGSYALPLKDAEASGAAKELARQETSAGPIAWERWSKKKVDKYLSNGRPVFVDFTADWCVTCKVNEQTVINSKKVVQAADEYDVAMLKADWTNGSERIRKELQRQGRAGVPLYLVYSSEDGASAESAPWKSSGILSAEALVGAFRAAAEDSKQQEGAE